MNQLYQTFHMIIFFWMIKPSRSYRSIYFCRIPDQIRFTFKRFSASKIFHITGNPAHSEFLIISLLASFLYTLCKCCTRMNNTPLGFSYIASFSPAMGIFSVSGWMVHVGKDLMGKNRSTTGIAITNVFENISQTHVTVCAGQISDGVEMKLAM